MLPIEPQYFPGYSVSRRNVLNQSTEKDLELIDDLFGRENLTDDSTPEEIKREALRQLEIEWRKPQRN